MEIVFGQERLAAPAGAIIGVVGEDASKLLEASGVPVAGPSEAAGVLSGPAMCLDRTLDVLAPAPRLLAEARIERMRRQGASILLASHSRELLRRLADEIWWVESGRVVAKGDPAEVLDRYSRDLVARLRESEPAAELLPFLRRGDGRAELVRLEMTGAGGRVSSIWRSGEEVTVRVAVRFHADVADPVVGMMIRSRIGVEVYGTNTELEGLKLGPCAAGDVREVAFTFRCDLCPQHYTLTAASHDPDGVWHDWMEDALAFTVEDTRYTAGVVNLRAKVSVRELPALENERRRES